MNSLTDDEIRGGHKVIKDSMWRDKRLDEMTNYELLAVIGIIVDRNDWMKVNYESALDLMQGKPRRQH